MHSKHTPKQNPLSFCSAMLFSLLLVLMISCDHSKKKQLIVSDTPGIGIQNTVTLYLFYQREYWDSTHNFIVPLLECLSHISPHIHFPLSCFPSNFWMDYKVKNCLYQWENKLSQNIFYSLYKSVSQAKKKKKKVMVHLIHNNFRKTEDTESDFSIYC